MFVPIAMESFGPLGSKATSFLSKLGRRITAATSDVKETSYLYQCISIAYYKDSMGYVYITFFVIYCMMTTVVDILISLILLGDY